MEHYTGHLLHQITKLPGTTYVKDWGTGWGRIYMIDFNGVRHIFCGMPIHPGSRVFINMAETTHSVVNEAQKKLDEINNPLTFDQMIKDMWSGIEELKKEHDRNSGKDRTV
jgi:hypothetical protein